MCSLMSRTRTALLAFFISVAAQAHPSWPSFSSQGKNIVSADFKRIEAQIQIDVAARKIRGTARLVFSALEPGYVMFDLTPAIAKVSLDSKPLPTSSVLEIRTPQGETQVRVLDQELAAATEHVLELEYELPWSLVSPGSRGGIELLVKMTDLKERGYMGAYAPVGFDFDSYPLALEISVRGTSAVHQAFANGSVSPLAESNSWRIEYRPEFTTNGFFFHVADHSFHTETGTFSGISATVPIRIYTPDDYDLARILSDVQETMKSNEVHFGPYLHPEMLICIRRARSGGMEYCGATDTSEEALGHEITHSWFGRGVMSGNGNSSWIDEAIASWRDAGFPRSSSNPDTRAVLSSAGTRPHNRVTPRQAYGQGMMLMAKIDYMLAEKGGLIPVLKKLVSEFAFKPLTTEQFLELLERESGLDFHPLFKRYVYGGRPPDCAVHFIN